MKSKILFSAILVAGLMSVNFSVSRVSGQTPEKQSAQQKTVKYTCPMHPEVVQDKPGNCPKCGMKLVEKKDKSKSDMHQKSDTASMNLMMHDSTNMKHNHMKSDTTSKKHDHMDM